MGSGTLADLGESAFLRRLKARVGRIDRAAHKGGPSHMTWQVGIGDDAAVHASSGPMVVTTDMLVEDVDFRRRWATWSDVGHKAAAVNLSDLAAMGAVPVGLTAALAAHPNELSQDMLQLLAQCHRVGVKYGAPLVGGDLSEIRGPLVLSITALGIAATKPIQRHQSRVGDRILVTGTLGAAAAGLLLLERPQLRVGVPKKLAAYLMARQLRPMPQCQAARALAQLGTVRSMADISDGLHQDVRHLVPKGLGVTLHADALPVAPGLLQVARGAKKPFIDLLLLGGEDFELVVSVPPAKVPACVAACAAVGTVLTEVGVVTGRRGVRYTGHAAPAWRHGLGFRHFSAAQPAA